MAFDPTLINKYGLLDITLINEEDKIKSYKLKKELLSLDLISEENKRIKNFFFESLRKTDLIKKSKIVKEDDNELVINVKEINLLPEYLSKVHNRLNYNDVMNLLLNIVNQIQFLELNEYSISHLELEDILVIEGIENIGFYLCNAGSRNIELGIENTNIYNMNDKDQLIINKPIIKTNFLSPELLKITELPSIIHKNSWIYSLGMILIFSINNILLDIGSSQDIIKKSIDNIESTKLYYCILRMMNEYPQKRVVMLL